MRLGIEVPVFAPGARAAFAPQRPAASSPGLAAPGNAAPGLAAAEPRAMPNPALAGMRESRALAGLAADIAEQLAEAAPASQERLRSRLREVVEIGSARDTSGPLAVLYAAARRDPAAPLARLLAATAEDPGPRAVQAEAARALRGLDDLFAARELALANVQPPGLAAPKSLLDLTV